ncbi:MAG TPA: class I SAM-dependent methyltransferase [Polyangiales bacterium]|nr:class I SAM-dependent methyltransferase [Polyangiales bacterium]
MWSNQRTESAVQRRWPQYFELFDVAFDDMPISQLELERVRATEAETFNRMVTERGDFNPFDDAGWKLLRVRFGEAARASRLDTLLDIGCGTGHSRQVYRESVRHYVGVDLSEVAIERARALFPADTFQVADAHALPFPDASFDAVAFSSVLHHIPDFARALIEGARVLRPGGVVFAFDPNLMHPAMALFRWPRSPFYSSAGVSPNERPLLGGELRRAFVAAGLRDVRQRAQSGIAYRAVALQSLNRLLAAYNLFDAAFERSGLARWFGTFLITWGTKPPSAASQPATSSA